jgi:DNA-directed RNA polymerase specialized sigma24 family protein
MMGGQRIGEAERARMIELARQGMPYPSIAEILDRPIGTISRALSDAILGGQLARRRGWEQPRTTAHYNWRDRT